MNRLNTQPKNNAHCPTCNDLCKSRIIQFEDKHNLKPSSFPNGAVCGHLHEIRSINFNSQNFNINNRKLNVKPVNLKMKNSLESKFSKL